MRYYGQWMRDRVFEKIGQLYPKVKVEVREDGTYRFGLKNWMWQRWNEFDCFRDCVDVAFKCCPNVSA